MRGVTFLAMGGLAAAAAGKPAEAHPHVWVDTAIVAVMEQGKVTALREEWLFDEDFSVMALSEVRKTKGMALAMGRPLTDGEVAGLKAKAFSNLANYGYFTHVWADGKVVSVAKEVTRFTARLESGRLVYGFVLGLTAPVAAKTVTVGLWDDSYYVDVGPAKGRPPLVEGDDAGRCRARIIDDKAHPIYNGSIIPKSVEISCGATP